MRKFLLGTVLAGVMITTPAMAHFQLLYTPEVNLENPADIPVKLMFWHPLENGHAMDMGAPQEFFYVFKEEKKDLKGQLKEITFHGANNDAKAFETTVKIQRNGDYIFALIPAPYFEKSEEKYIQQITKSYLNKGGAPTGWEKPLGLPTEIVPLNKPTNILAGSTFSGVVLADGKPVPGVEIEIEYIAAQPDMKTNKPGKTTVSPAPGGAIVAVTDERGVFTFGIPKAGFWGFAALGSGAAKQFEGKELSQDAVIWVRAYDFK